jgi:hypothetical protein
MANWNDAYRAAMTAEITPQMLRSAGLKPSEIDLFYRGGDGEGYSPVFKQFRGQLENANQQIDPNYASRVISDLPAETLMKQHAQTVANRNRMMGIYNQLYNKTEADFLRKNSQVKFDPTFNINKLTYAQSPAAAPGISPEQQYQYNQDQYQQQMNQYMDAQQQGLNNLMLTPELLASVGLGSKDIQSILSKNPSGLTYQQAKLNNINMPGRMGLQGFNPQQDIANLYQTRFAQVNAQPIMREVPGYTPPPPPLNFGIQMPQIDFPMPGGGFDPFGPFVDTTSQSPASLFMPGTLAAK